MSLFYTNETNTLKNLSRKSGGYHDLLETDQP